MNPFSRWAVLKINDLGLPVDNFPGGFPGGLGALTCGFPGPGNFFLTPGKFFLPFPHPFRGGKEGIRSGMGTGKR